MSNNTGWGRRVRKSNGWMRQYIRQYTTYLQVKYQGKAPLNNEQTNNEGQECKTDSR
jgi:hypothetical protein